MRAHPPESTRIKFRSPDLSGNPYLAFALLLTADLDGIRRELPLASPSEENLYLIVFCKENARSGKTLDWKLAPEN